MEVESAKILGGSIVVSTILYCVCLLFTASNTKETGGRFQLVSDPESSQFLVDTQTGKVWPRNWTLDVDRKIFFDSKMDVVD